MDITDADQDSDSGYTTNQPDIVEHARNCYLNYPTIVNNIPKEKNIYKNTMNDYARIDNGLANSQLDIGEASNLAQIAQTYSYNFNDPKFSDYVCILSVLAQIAIDNAKRRFDLNLGSEIQRIKKDMNIKQYGYPAFWDIIKKGFNKSKINKYLICPMNYLYNLKLSEFHSEATTLPFSYFFKKYELNLSRKKCKKVEELITKYSFKTYYVKNVEDNNIKHILLRNDYDDMIEDIRHTNISGNYIGLFSWLIDRAFMITPQITKNNYRIKSKINKNKSLLLKVLYDVNSKNLLGCFSKKY